MRQHVKLLDALSEDLYLLQHTMSHALFVPAHTHVKASLRPYATFCHFPIEHRALRARQSSRMRVTGGRNRGSIAAYHLNGSSCRRASLCRA